MGCRVGVAGLLRGVHSQLPSCLMRLARAAYPGHLGSLRGMIMSESTEPRRSAAEMIEARTQLKPVPLVPDIQVYQADDPIGLWRRTELTSGPAGLDPPYWAFAWAGGLALARYLLDHPEIAEGRRVIDVAAGSGVAAIAAAKAGAAAVTAYDIDPVAAVAIEMNAAANGV